MRSPMNRTTPGALAWQRKKRQALARVGKRGKVRKVEWDAAKVAHLALEPGCRGPRLCLPGRCWGRLDVHHVIPRGMGGGKDYGVYATLCRAHHDWTETHRAEARALGLLMRAWGRAA
ncbi:MAG: hypothetical protein M0R75_13630 [Dehalococcoidia bacterium]|nr:hypothetical protein [Dehalococcoidia bacterium]